MKISKDHPWTLRTLWHASPRLLTLIAAPQVREVPEWETTVAKIIFYLTVAASVWFFYWLNGINCPC